MATCVASFIATCNGVEIDAQKLIKAATNIAGGKGDGKANYAQASGGDISKIQDAITAALNVASKAAEAIKQGGD